MNLAQLEKIQKNHSQHPVMKETQAICKDGTKVSLITKMNGVTFVFTTPASFDKFLKEYDKRNGRKK